MIFFSQLLCTESRMCSWILICRTALNTGPFYLECRLPDYAQCITHNRQVRVATAPETRRAATRGWQRELRRQRAVGGREGHVDAAAERPHDEPRAVRFPPTQEGLDWDPTFTFQRFLLAKFDQRASLKRWYACISDLPFDFFNEDSLSDKKSPFKNIKRQQGKYLLEPGAFLNGCSRRALQRAPLWFPPMRTRVQLPWRAVARPFAQLHATRGCADSTSSSGAITDFAKCSNYIGFRHKIALHCFMDKPNVQQSRRFQMFCHKTFFGKKQHRFFHIQKVNISYCKQAKIIGTVTVYFQGWCRLFIEIIISEICKIVLFHTWFNRAAGFVEELQMALVKEQARSPE